MKINEKINLGISTLRKYQIEKSVSGPDCIFKHGTRDMPGYSEERIALMIEEVRKRRTKKTIDYIIKFSDRAPK